MGLRRDAIMRTGVTAPILSAHGQDALPPYAATGRKGSPSKLSIPESDFDIPMWALFEWCRFRNGWE